jgi:hypothetical protein
MNTNCIVTAVKCDFYFTVAGGTSGLLPRQHAVEMVEIDIVCRVMLHGVYYIVRGFAMVFAIFMYVIHRILHDLLLNTNNISPVAEELVSTRVFGSLVIYFW